jgi:putative glutathione S-transferase
MGYLQDGKWIDGPRPIDASGDFKRQAAQFRKRVTADGSSGFPAEAGRYHLYISLACPWAHRTLVFRKLKKLDDIVSLSIVAPIMTREGWAFDAQWPDHLNAVHHMHQVYTLAAPDYSGRVTVPVLWDKQRGTIVNNESSEIIRMFNSEFAALTDDRTDYYPEHLRAEIDSVNELVYESVNNGVYRCGFATTQAAYERAFERLFGALDQLEERLSRQRYLAGDVITEADWRFFTTLIRFDAVYVGHFKCNLRRIDDYHNVSNYLRELYQVPGVADTVDIQQYKRHYYMSHENINPTRIVPVGPALDFSRPHDRGKRFR